MLKVDSNIKEVAGSIEKASRQLPFATARALTWTAKDAQARLKQELPHRFDIRSPHTTRGIRIRPARKDKLQAQVGSLDWYMAEQELGATRRPLVAEMLAIPVRVKTNKAGKITKANRPAALLDKKKHFINVGKGGKSLFIYKRTGKKRHPILPLYLLRPKAEIPERWGMEKTVAQAVKVKFFINLNKSLRKAMETAR